jgi:hypothetical protein
MRARCVAFCLLLAGGAPALAQSPAPGVGPDQLTWRAGPPSLPKGAQMAVLNGDPGKKGPFVLRLKLPANYVIPPHQHPTSERLTVLYGILNTGIGDKVDKRKTKALERGAALSIPAQTTHYAWTSGETVVQVDGTGPFVMTYADPADDPGKAQSQ